MLFELRNASVERVSHCGVLEFIAEEGMIYMPYWVGDMMFIFFKSSYCCPQFNIDSLVDDGKSFTTRRRHRKSEKCNSSKGYIC